MQTPSVHFWRVKFEPKLGVKQHRVTSWSGHALFAPILSGAFQTLRVSAAIWEQDHEWLSLHAEPNISLFEGEHGKETERARYNAKQRARAIQSGKIVRSEHAGFSDFFVPMVVQGKVIALLVVGPFQLERPSARVILARWHRLTGRRGHPSDPEFAQYLSMTLATLVLEGDRVEVFGEMLGFLAALMAGTGNAEKLANRAEVLRGKLVQLRRVEESWDVVQRL
ncbi:MAG TPA: PocR ligand-binding domain-containing protein, partial [Polyangiaceae bacterium]|nr:PocR ligand-binding domain-containing protein [Polyangiaceae bacterium]